MRDLPTGRSAAAGLSVDTGRAHTTGPFAAAGLSLTPRMSLR